MSFINDVGEFIGSGKAENVFDSLGNVAGSVNNFLGAIGVKSTSDNTTSSGGAVVAGSNNAVQKALGEFEAGYLKGRFGDILPVAFFVGAVVLGIYLLKGK